MLERPAFLEENSQSHQESWMEHSLLPAAYNYTPLTIVNELDTIVNGRTIVNELDWELSSKSSCISNKNKP